MNIRLKRIILSAAIALAFFVLLCTIASRTIYNLLLPRVEATVSSSGAIQSSAKFNGVFTSPEPIKIKNNSLLPIKDILVQQGDIVAEGDALFKLDTGTIEASIRQYDINIQRQKNDMNSGSYTGGDVLVKQMELDAMQIERALLAAKLPRGGALIKAEANGVVDFENIDASNNEILHIYPENDVLDIEFSATAADLEAVKNEKSDLSVNITAADGKKNSTNLAFVDAKPLKEVQGLYIVKLRPTADIDAQLGEKANISLSTNSPIYDCVLPLSAVNQGVDASYIYVINERQSLWGLENYVQKVIVDVKDSNYATAAVISDIPLAAQKIVQHTSKPLKDGDCVFVE